MAVLEGMDKILNIINKFLEDYDVTAYWNEDFEAVCDENKIGFTLAPTQEDLNYFMNDAQSRYSFVQADPMLWLLFHFLTSPFGIDTLGNCETMIPNAFHQNFYLKNTFSLRLHATVLIFLSPTAQKIKYRHSTEFFKRKNF